MPTNMPLVVSNDGNTVYDAIFKSGNQTTALSEGAVCNSAGLGASSLHHAWYWAAQRLGRVRMISTG
jgi:hypothetical protein